MKEIETGISDVVEQMIEEYNTRMNRVIYQKLKDIGKQLIDEYGTSDANSSQHEQEERSRIRHIGRLLNGLEAFVQTSDTLDNLRALNNMGVRLKLTPGEITQEFDALSKTFKVTQQAPLIEVQLVKDIAKL